MYHVYTSPKDWRVEKVIYRAIGADPKAQQPWYAYARSVLAFSAVSVLFLFFFQLVQGKLPLHLHDPATPMTPSLAWNTAISFVTNTNWQGDSAGSGAGRAARASSSSARRPPPPRPPRRRGTPAVLLATNPKGAGAGGGPAGAPRVKGPLRPPRPST